MHVLRKTLLIKTLARKIVKERPLYAQIMFTVLAFFVMFILSYYFSSRLVRNNLLKSSENTLILGQSKIEHYLNTPKVSLVNLSRTVSEMIRHGYTAEQLKNYIIEISKTMCVNEDMMSYINDVHLYLEKPHYENMFVSGIDRSLPEGYIPTQRPWYISADKTNDTVIGTLPYISSSTGEYVFAYTRSLFDDEGCRLGVIALDVRINDMRKEIVDMALAQGGYGMMFDQNLIVIAHPNLPFEGIDIKTSHPSIFPPTVFLDDLIKGENLLNRVLYSYRNEYSIAHFKKLTNGWYWGVVTPRYSYYEDIYRMTQYLGILSIALAAVMIFILVKLDSARVKADMESKYKSAFLANMSHEIRTPMNAIIGMTSIGKSAEDVKRKDYCFSKIEDASKHLLGVINDILDMSKIEANKLELSPTEFDFEKMLQRVVNVVNFRIGEKRQDLSVRIDKSIPNMLIGDDQRLAQVITNLLSNATKFTPEGGSIRLDTRFLGEENDYNIIQFRVSDTGIGISKEQMENLFQSFHQAESNTSRRFGGTGLGLSISKSIVEMMNGKIWVESELGKGATFIFNVSIMRGESTSRVHLKRGVNWSNVRVLAVDDEESVLTYIQEIMRGFGVVCDVAASGEEALSIVKQKGAYNIYFVDWRMPGIDGIKLTTKLKQNGYADPDKAVIIMISAAELSIVEVDAKKAGVDKFLSKPLFPSAIMDILNEFLDVEQQHKKDTSESSTNFSGYFAGYQVLLAEDVKVNCEIVMALFEPTLLKIDCVENGLEAISAFGESPEKYDLIFMDIQMPVMDGYEAAKRIRAMNIARAKTIPIIAMTANVFKEDVERCIEVGMNDHVGKPLDFDEVAEKLRKYLPKKKS